MRTFLTTTTDRKTGDVTIACAPSLHSSKHDEYVKRAASSMVNDSLSELIVWVPKRVFRFTTKAESAASEKEKAAWDAAEEKRLEAKRVAGGKVVQPQPMKSKIAMKTAVSTAVSILVALAALIFTCNANAQRYGSEVTLWSWKALVGPTNLVGTDPAVYGTLANGGVIDGSKQNIVAVQVGFNYNTNTVATNGICWLKSINQTEWDTNNPVLTYFHQTAAPAAAGQRSVWSTNLTMNGAGYYKFLFWTNSSYGAASTVWPTNISVTWAPKIP